MIRNTVLIALLSFSLGTTAYSRTASPEAQPRALAMYADLEGCSCRSPIRYDGLGVRPGRKQALPFGAGLISFPETSERVVAIHPSGKELFFTSNSNFQIMQSLYR